MFKHEARLPSQTRQIGGILPQQAHPQALRDVVEAQMILMDDAQGRL